MSFSRRSLLSALGIAAAVPAAPVVVSLAAKAEEPEGSFTHPADYLAEMQKIGMRPVTGFHRLPGGGIHRMGVIERAINDEEFYRNQSAFRRIQLRCPVQMAVDMPQGDWWNWVAQYLYDKGFREDLTPPKLAARLAREARS